MNDEDFYDDSQIGLEVNGKRWAGRNYGFQSEESYNKLFVQGKLNPAQQAIDRATSSFTNLPGIKQSLQFIGGATKFVYQQLPEPVQQAAEFAAAKNQEAAENIAATTGLPVALTDPTTIADIITGGATLAAKPAVKTALRETVEGAANLGRNLPPPGAAPQLAMAGSLPMTPVPTPKIQGGSVFMSTTSPEWTSPKAGLGSAKSKQFAPAVERWEQRESAWQGVINSLKESYDSGNINAAKLKKELSEVQSIRKGDLSTFDYDPESLYSFFEGLKESPYYKQTRKRGELKQLQEARPQDPYDVLKKAQQHHILAKAETKPFVETLMRLMNENIANKDDLVNFFVWSEKYDLIPGNVQKNLLHMGEITHTVAKKDPMALHNILKQAGLEYGSKTGPEIIRRYGLNKVKSADELMKAYDRYLQEIAVPSKDITYKVQDWWYNKTIKTLKGQELKDFKERFAKLNDPRRQ
jgi:hypothetical protein